MDVLRKRGIVLLAAMALSIPLVGTAQERPTMESRGREFLARTPGGAAFQSTCARSVRATDAGTVFAQDATDAEIGGYCRCMAAYLFSDKNSAFYGRMPQVTQRAAAGSLMTGALQDAKATGGESRALYALGFYADAQQACNTAHLDRQARAAAAAGKAAEALVDGQVLPERYRQEIDKVAARYGGDGTLLLCRSSVSQWPNTRETLFILEPRRSRGDYYDGLISDAEFAAYTGEFRTRDANELKAALADMESIAQAIDTETFTAPYPMKQQGDFYRLPLFDGRKEIGHFCLSRAPGGKSYFAGNPPGGKLVEGLNALLGAEDTTACSVERANNARSFRDHGGGLMAKCDVLANGTGVQDHLRGALEDRAKRFKALPVLLRDELQRREAKRQSDYRF